MHIQWKKRRQHRQRLLGSQHSSPLHRPTFICPPEHPPSFPTTCQWVLCSSHTQKPNPWPSSWPTLQGSEWALWTSLPWPAGASRTALCTRHCVPLTSFSAPLGSAELRRWYAPELARLISHPDSHSWANTSPPCTEFFLYQVGIIQFLKSTWNNALFVIIIVIIHHRLHFLSPSRIVFPPHSGQSQNICRTSEYEPVTESMVNTKTKKKTN